MPKVSRRFLAGLLLLGLLVGSAFLAWPARAVTIYGVGPEPIAFTTRRQTVAAALAAAGAEVGPYDLVEPGLDQQLPTDGVIEVHRAKRISLAVDRQVTAHQLVVSTAGEVLAALGVELGPLDRVEPAVTTPVADGDLVRVIRVEERLTTHEEEIPFETERRPDRTLDYGLTEELAPGRPGVVRVTVKTRYEDGEPVASEEVDRTVLLAPEDRVVAYGMAQTISRGGQVYRYSQSMTLLATAYSPEQPGLSNYTATGLLAQRGVVAVDPAVIPLGTRLYIDGYGYAIAADTGGAIKGNRIDLCYDTVAEAWAFGVQEVTVYILD